VREPLDRAKELLLCGKRSLEKLGAKRDEHRAALENKTNALVVRGPD
jgi:hypothetical protein